MTIQVDLDPATEARLTAEAAAQGIALEIYAGSLLRQSLPNYATGTGVLTTGRLNEMLSGLAKYSNEMPVLALEADNRDSCYEDIR